MKGHFYKRGKKWTYVVDIGIDEQTGKRRQKTKGGFATKKEAQTAAAKLITELKEGSYLEPTKLTVKEFFLQYLEARKLNLREGTYYNYKKHIDNHIIPKLGYITLQKLTGLQLERFYAQLQEHMKPVTIRSVHQIIGTALKYAVRHGLIQKSPAEVVSPPKGEMKTVNTWSEEDVRAFLSYVRNSRYYIAYVLAIMCGMRKGEILGLKWSDIDWKRKTLSVNRTLSHISGQFHEPKTAAGKRLIDIPDVVIDALQEQQGRLEKEKEAFGAGYNDLDLVCPNSFGEPCKFRNLTELWKKAIKRSGVPDIRFHDLRHTHATLMLKQGVHPKIVSERLGHSRVGVTLDTYSHVVPGLQKEAVEKFADHLFSEKK